MNEKILVVEDDPSIALGLAEILKQEGYSSVLCKRGDKALETSRTEEPALVILDVMLPGENGYDICRKLREAKFTGPILMLTAKGQELDKVIGLDCGADDYVTKPFGVRELIARIQALLRRCNGQSPAVTNTAGTFKIGSAEIDPKTFELRTRKQSSPLTARELKLLQTFHEHPGEVLSRDRLLNEVWGTNYFGTTRTLDQVIVQLRKKLGDPAENPRHLLTVHGVGYRFVP